MTNVDQLHYFIRWNSLIRHNLKDKKLISKTSQVGNLTTKIRASAESLFLGVLT